MRGSNSAIKPVILDVDTCIDDAKAIAYAAHSPELQLQGLTTLYGDVSVKEATRNTLYVLELLGREDIPVYARTNHLDLCRSADQSGPGHSTGPGFSRLAGQVVVMCGAVNVPGNVTKYAEANIHSDPEAADIVFRSGLPVTLVGLDVTMKTLLPRAKLQE